FFAKLVVPEGGGQIGGEFPAQLLQTFGCAGIGGWIAHANESRIAGIISIGDDIIWREWLAEELIEQAIVRKWIALPHVMTIELHHDADGRIGNALEKESATLLLGSAGVVNIAENRNGQRARHGVLK